MRSPLKLLLMLLLALTLASCGDMQIEVNLGPQQDATEKTGPDESSREALAQMKQQLNTAYKQLQAERAINNGRLPSPERLEEVFMEAERLKVTPTRNIVRSARQRACRIKPDTLSVVKIAAQGFTIVGRSKTGEHGGIVTIGPDGVSANSHIVTDFECR